MDHKEKELHRYYDQFMNLYYVQQTLQLYETIQLPIYHSLNHLNHSLGNTLYNSHIEELIYYFERHPEQLTETGKQYHASLRKQYLLQQESIEHFGQLAPTYKQYFATIWERAIHTNELKDVLPAMEKQKRLTQQLTKKLYALNDFDYLHISTHYDDMPIDPSIVDELNLFKSYLQQLYYTIEKQERRFIQTNYLNRIAPHDQLTIFKSVVTYFTDTFQIGTIFIHETTRLRTNWYQTKCDEFHICLSSHATTVQRLDSLLYALGVLLQNNIKQRGGQSFDWAMYVHFLPLYSETFCQLLADIILPYCSVVGCTLAKLVKELRGHYLQLRQNILQPGLIAPLQKIIYAFLEYEIEQSWLNDVVQTDELPRIWKEKTFKQFNVKPAHHMEGVLRPDTWKFGAFGSAIRQLYYCSQLLALREYAPKIDWWEQLLQIWHTPQKAVFTKPFNSHHAARALYRLYRVPFKKMTAQ